MLRAKTIDGIAVAYADLGGAGPDLLLAHATGFHALVWKPVAAALAGSFHCYAFDERGHGDTAPPPDGNFEWQGFARDALAVVDAEQLGRPFGVGHSAGGAALLLAELDRPGTFEAIYCYEPIVPPVVNDERPVFPPGANPLAASARRRREVFESRDAAYENYAGKPPLGIFSPEALWAYVDHGFEDLPDGSVRLKCRGEQEARTYEMSMGHRTFTRLQEIACPVTIAYGELSDTFGAGAFELIAERLPAGRAEMLPRLTHFGPMQDPAAVAASIANAFSA